MCVYIVKLQLFLAATGERFRSCRGWQWGHWFLAANTQMTRHGSPVATDHRLYQPHTSTLSTAHVNPVVASMDDLTHDFCAASLVLLQEKSTRLSLTMAGFHEDSLNCWPKNMWQ